METLKSTAISIAVLIAVFFAGWFINGKRTDHQWREKIGSSPVVFQYFERYVDVVLPGIPADVPGKPTKDTTGIARALDSLHSIYRHSLAVQKQLAQPFTGTYRDTLMLLRYTAQPIRRMVSIDTLWIRPVRCDSVVVTKTVIDTVKQTASIRTAASVSIGAAAGAKIGGIPGAAIGSLAGLAFDWIF